ncbi:MAG TPA: sodium/proline symporter [Caulobacterales bacterium]|nr:sodium/proline symporter [Caulobacterales bacterium]
MTDTQLVVAAFAATYTAIIIVYGIWRSRIRRASDEDYFLAGRSMGPWLTAFSGAASAESGWVMLGLVGTAYASGLSALWLIPGTLFGYLFSWLVLGPRLRAASSKHGTITIPETLAALSDRHKAAIRLVASIIILVFLTAYVAAQFNAVGKAMNAIFELPYWTGVVVGMVLVLSYIIFGGFRASVWADFLQAILMVATLLVVPIIAFAMAPTSLQTLATAQPQLFDFTAGNAGLALLGFVLGWVGIGLGYPGQPHVVVKFMAAESEARLRLAGVIAVVWSHLVFLGAILLGLLIRAQIPGLSDPEQAMPTFALNNLSAPLAGMAVAGILAAIFSTASGQLLVAVSTLGYDLLGRQAQKGSYTPWRNELVVVVLGLAAGGFALTQNRVIFEFVLYAWAALGASIGCALIGLLLFRRVSGTGVLACLIGGAATVVIWKAVPGLSSSVYELIPAFVVGLLLVRMVLPRRSAVPSGTDAASTSAE